MTIIDNYINDYSEFFRNYIQLIILIEKNRIRSKQIFHPSPLSNVYNDYFFSGDSQHPISPIFHLFIDSLNDIVFLRTEQYYFKHSRMHV